MTSWHPSLLRLRRLFLRPRLSLTEVQLVDDVVRYRHIDSRDRVPTEVRATRPSGADWTRFRVALDEAAFWQWPRRWPRGHDVYVGEFAIGIEWNGRGVVSAGPIGVAPEVDAVLDEVRHLVGNGPQRASEPVPTLLSPTRPPPYRLDLLGDADRACAARSTLREGTSAARITP